ncbi:MAG: aminopeptidase P family protein, partial [Deltaproteobacteria bacterium]|nr:aminopeptidase P family protein [Deltaproteobacteria bacterium]
YAIVTGDAAWLITDSRYTTQAKAETKGFKVRLFRKALETLRDLLGELKVRTLAFESNNITYDNLLRLRKAFKGIRLKPVSAALLDEGYKKAEAILRPGVAERDAALEIEFAFRAKGAEGLAFDTIIASGERGALPHGKADLKKIKKGELVVVDMGVLKDGYNSDETRTYCMGKATSEQKKVYDVVRGAQERALNALKPGVRASVVDLAARQYIEKAGYGRYFGHGTGHGVGLDIHESPGIGPLSKDVLKEGMVVTVEPGIYIPGWGGVRIEDMALVVKGGFEIITTTSKDLRCL